MDNTEEFTVIEWCAGYGGIHLGLKRAIRNLRVVAYGEIEAFACANLVAKMEAGLLDEAPIWTDIKTFPCEEFRDRVDLLVAGYPCQPFSAAGRRLGAEDPRHLWPHIARAIRVIRPRLCFFENVEGHISLGLREVVGELEQIGYSTAWGIFSAAEVGAPHQRKRVFILAYDQSQRIQGHWADWLQESRPHAGQGLPLRGGDAGCGELADANNCGGGEDWKSTELWAVGLEQSPGNRGGNRSPQRGEVTIWPSRPGEPQHGWEPPRVVGNAAIVRTQRERPEQQTTRAVQSSCSSSIGNESDGKAQFSLGRNAPRRLHGVDIAELSGLSHSELAEIREWMVRSDNRTDELRLLGNGVVPATAERAFCVLMEELMGGQNHGR